MADKNKRYLPQICSEPNALKMINLLAEARRGMTLSEITEKTGMEESTVRDLFSVLKESGYIEELVFDGNYTLGATLFEISCRVASSFAIGNTNLNHVQKFIDEKGETVHLVMLRDRLLEVAKEISASLLYRPRSEAN